MYSFLKSILFKIDPERAHGITTQQLAMLAKTPVLKNWLRSWWDLKHPSLERNIMGLKFPNPIGLAAGFDKDGTYVDSMMMLGFGFYEVGTVTPKPQAGNEKPRLFRLPEDQALVNRMGFNNAGVDHLVKQLDKRKRGDMIVGGNIGKNKITKGEETLNDYTSCFESLFRHVDYFTINVSSPNTPGLRNLQEKGPLNELLKEIQKRNQLKNTPKPLLLKIAPDLSLGQIDDILDIVDSNKLDGIIATNTTISREGLVTNARQVKQIGQGGLSGMPVREISNQVINHIRKHASDDLVVVGVGGISNPNDALEKLDLGANLIQIYTGLIYYGPTLIRDIKRAILKFYK